MFDGRHICVSSFRCPLYFAKGFMENLVRISLAEHEIYTIYLPYKMCHAECVNRPHICLRPAIAVIYTPRAQNGVQRISALTH